MVPGAPVVSHHERQSHVTFHLLFPSQDDEPVSQMYFDGERLNEKDWWLSSALPGTTDVLIAKLLPWPSDLEADLQLVIFDIVTLWR